jgi:hypothetical protein
MIKVTRSLGGVPLDDEDDLEGITPPSYDSQYSGSHDNSHYPTSWSGQKHNGKSLMEEVLTKQTSPA